jgi:WhiB family redox-sensing transcriptional regulator
MTGIKLAAHGTSTGAGNGDWRDQASCLDKDPELWFPIGSTGPAVPQIEKAKAWCRTCPVMQTCLRWALDTSQDAGVWGGLSEDERRSLKRREARNRANSSAPPSDARSGRGKRDTYVPTADVREILADAFDRRWTVKQIAAATGCKHGTIESILYERSLSVTEATAQKIAVADLDGPPPVPAEAQTAVRC